MRNRSPHNTCINQTRRILFLLYCTDKSLCMSPSLHLYIRTYCMYACSNM